MSYQVYLRCQVEKERDMDTRFTCNNISFFKNKAMSIKTTALSSNMPHPLYSWCKSRHVGDLWIIFGWEISILIFS